nr:MAG TPA: tail completion protein [Caudoviricetes sp.]
MSSRLDLQTILEKILGSHNVYFQPPSSVRMQYPAIIYKRKDIEKRHADDGAYRKLPSYEVVLIDKNPDSKVIEKIFDLPYCSYDRHYESDNLNHDVFTLYF